MAGKIPMYQFVLDKITGAVEQIARYDDVRYQQRLREWGEAIEKSRLTIKQKSLIIEMLNHLVSRLWDNNPEVDDRIKRARDYLKILIRTIS